MTSSDSTQRFSDRVEAYVQYRPHYPDELYDLLGREIGLAQNNRIADIGSGTGISSELFLRNGVAVYAVEPNEPMRNAAEEWLGENPLFHSVDGTAEKTTLQAESVHAVIAGQAFHWFHREHARAEFKRILQPDGYVVLFWNSRRTEGTPFLKDYEALLQRFGTDYRKINHQNISEEDIAAFFAPDAVQHHTLYNEQICDMDQLRGRLESSSYVPDSTHPDYEPMIAELTNIFNTHQQNGHVRIVYDVEVFTGRLSS